MVLAASPRALSETPPPSFQSLSSGVWRHLASLFPCIPCQQIDPKLGCLPTSPICPGPVSSPSGQVSAWSYCFTFSLLCVPGTVTPRSALIPGLCFSTALVTSLRLSVHWHFGSPSPGTWTTCGQAFTCSCYSLLGADPLAWVGQRGRSFPQQRPLTDPSPWATV